jgi:LPXTG-motif cell wall-anchored protein
MYMKKIGMFIIGLGLLATLFGGFNFVTKKKIIDVGNLEITTNKNHVMDWSPLFGIALIVVGAGLVLYGRKKG